MILFGCNDLRESIVCIVHPHSRSTSFSAVCGFTQAVELFSVFDIATKPSLQIGFPVTTTVDSVLLFPSSDDIAGPIPTR